MFDQFFQSTQESVGYPAGLLVLKPLLLHTNVHLDTTRLVEKTACTLATILECVVLPEQGEAVGRDQGVLGDLLRDRNRDSDRGRESTKQSSAQTPSNTPSGVQLPFFDPCRELQCCPGALPSKTGETFCTVYGKVCVVCVRLCICFDYSYSLTYHTTPRHTTPHHTTPHHMT